MFCLSGTGLIACKDVDLFEAFSCPWPPSPTCYKLLEIERLCYDGMHVFFCLSALGLYCREKERIWETGTWQS